jgi:predicted dienelactone hydrolase
MKYLKNLCLVLCAFIIASNAYAFERKTLVMFDKARGRNVPVVIYHGETTNKPAAIINHGYQIKNTEYSFIAQALAAHGYFVVSIQHRRTP